MHRKHGPRFRAVQNPTGCELKFSVLTSSERMKRGRKETKIRASMNEKPAKRGRGCHRKFVSDNVVSNDDRGQAKEESQEVSHWNELPEFFKIYISALCSNSMKIPPAFIKKFGERIPKNVTLRMPSGLSFQVRMHQTHEHWFFQKGWPEFVLENSLEDGDFLTFCYVCDSEFLVKVFARNGCRKRSNKTSMIDEEPVVGKGTPEPENNSQYRATRSNVNPKRSSVRKTGRCRNPCFTLIPTKLHIATGCLHVPANFWRVHLRRLKHGSTMATLWIRNESWGMGLRLSANRLRLGKGWKQFVQDNSLNPGDSCTFELVDIVDLSFKVTISR